jgi:signal transduction histidine kinase
VLAHEIRNPLGSIKGFAQYLLEQQSESDRLKSPLSGEIPRPKHDAALPGNLHHKTSDYLTIIVSESQRLEELTEDLLVYARPVEARPLEFNLAATVQEVVESLRRVDPKARDAGMTVSIPESLRIETDQDKLRQIVANLLQNSLDAVPPGGSITVIARADRGRVTLAVKDNGPGMDAETLARAREPFFTTKTQGTGLGLAIVSRLTQALSGTIDIESAPGKGTTVTLTFPARVGRSS